MLTINFAHTEAEALSRAFFGSGTGDIFLNNMNCRGDEASLLQCLGDGPGGFCSHIEDASVRCPAPPCESLLQ